MFLFVATIHIVASFILVLFVLLQNPKGGALGVFGGQASSKSVFGSTGASDFLITVTKWSAVVFALTSIYLAYMTSKEESSVILDNPAASVIETQDQEPTPPDEKSK